MHTTATPPTKPRAGNGSCSLMAFSSRGEWPSKITDLPLFLTQQQYAHLRGITVRALQRERRLGKSIPFKKRGKQVLYARKDVPALVRRRMNLRSSKNKKIRPAECPFGGPTNSDQDGYCLAQASLRHKLFVSAISFSTVTRWNDDTTKSFNS